jgi:hypothetical protein
MAPTPISAPAPTSAIPSAILTPQQQQQQRGQLTSILLPTSTLTVASGLAVQGKARVAAALSDAASDLTVASGLPSTRALNSFAKSP